MSAWSTGRTPSPLKDLGEKTNRGKRERVEASKSGGGLRYGCKVEKQVVEAIAGSTIPSMKQKMSGLAAGKRVLTALLADVSVGTPNFLPSASMIYAQKITKLSTTQKSGLIWQQALRLLIGKVVLAPG